MKSFRQKKRNFWFLVAFVLFLLLIPILFITNLGLILVVIVEDSKGSGPEPTAYYYSLDELMEKTRVGSTEAIYGGAKKECQDTATLTSCSEKWQLNKEVIYIFRKGFNAPTPPKGRSVIYYFLTIYKDENLVILDIYKQTPVLF